MLPARLDRRAGELLAKRLATLLGAATEAGAFDGMLMLYEHDTTLLGLFVQLAITMLGLTPATLARPSSTASRAAGLDTNAGPLPTAMSVVPRIVATAAPDAGTAVVEELVLG